MAQTAGSIFLFASENLMSPVRPLFLNFISISFNIYIAHFEDYNLHIKVFLSKFILLRLIDNRMIKYITVAQTGIQTKLKRREFSPEKILFHFIN
jgi:hypothetical protein